MLHKLIYLLGVKLRSPELIDKYKFLKESEQWSLEELETWQLEQLKRILHIAYDRSLFYRELFDNANVNIEDIRSLADLKKIPIISKADLLNNTSAIQNKTGYRRLFFSETSGSTGDPLAFYRNSAWDAGHRAAQLRGYSWFGIKPWDLNGYFGRYSFKAKKIVVTRMLDALLNRFCLFSYNSDDFLRFSEKLGHAVYLEGPASMIGEAAIFINEHALGPFNLKMIKGTSEMIFDSYQEAAKKAFGKKIVSEYGATETGIIAYECQEGHMHITMENVIVEEVNGEAVITNLISDSFPVIRYKLGDGIVLDNETVCPCGMKHKIISEVTGRVGRTIFGKRSKYPAAALNYIFKNLIVEYNMLVNYQVIQKEKGRLEIYLNREISKDEEKILISECYACFLDDIEVVIYQNSLKRDYTKKFIDFISEVQ